MGASNTDNLDLFNKKLKAKEYISLALFRSAKMQDTQAIPADFDLEQHNKQVLNADYEKYQDYFTQILAPIDPKIKLDEEQIKAILADEEQALIIAGAGTGKTTTMTAKVKYLVDIKKIDPSKILVLSYTRKAVLELRERINIALDIPAEVITFHSLGFKYLKSLFPKRRCYIVDDNQRRQIFLDFLKQKVYTSAENIGKFMECFNASTINQEFVFGSFFVENAQKFENFDEYFSAYKSHKISEVKNFPKIMSHIIKRDINREKPLTIRGEWVKSKGEAVIANFLFMHGIDYEYEKLYDYALPDHGTYRPDFTLNLGGDQVFVEYFGLSTYGEERLPIYQKIRKMKEDYHRKHHTRFIALDYKPNQGYLDGLAEKLREFGFELREKSDQEIYSAILDNNPLAELFGLNNFFYKVVDMVKSSLARERLDDVINEELKKFKSPAKLRLAKKQYQFISEFLKFYKDELYSNPQKTGFDYADLIYYSKRFITRLGDQEFRYDYIIIDEYQDISMDRYELAKSTVDRNSAKLLAVGDDWQTIYSFAGSRIEYIYDFQQYFPHAKLLSITKTYRNPQTLINYAGEFIMKNPDQIKKRLWSDRDLPHPIVFYGFGGETMELARQNEYESLHRAILSIHRQRPNDSILVLARRNRDIDGMFDYISSPFIDQIDTQVSIRGVPDFRFDAMTIHSAKGLTADWVIVIGLDRKFPSSRPGYFWIYDLFYEEPHQEKIEYAEERRVFYVALTRTKNFVILMRNRNPANRSAFLKELERMVRDDDKLSTKNFDKKRSQS